MIPVLSLKMAYRHVRAGFGRMTLSVVAVALGVALVVAIQVMNAAVLRSFLDTVDAMAGRAALTVTAGGELTFNEEEVVDAIAAVPGIKLAVPLVRNVTFRDDGSGELLTVHGVDLSHDAAVRLYHRNRSTEFIEDPLAFLSQPDSILIGREFADRKGLTTGSKIDLVTPAGVKQFTIRGLLDPEGLAGTLGGRLVVMDLWAAERAFTADGQINEIDLVVADDEDVDAVKAAVAAALPAGLTVEEPTFRKNVVRKSISAFQAMLTAFSLVGVIAGFVICYSRLGAVFQARTWEVGLLRAVGLGRALVFGELLKESLLLGAAGTAAGLVLGTLIGRYALPFLAAATALNFRSPVLATNATVIEPRALLLGAVVGFIAASAAAVFPALRLARTQPVAALTMRGREMASTHPQIRWGLRSGLIVSICGLIVWQQVSHIAAVGLVTTGLMALAICALAAPFVALGRRPVGLVWKRALGPTGELAINRIGGEPRGTALTIGTIGVGLGAVLMFGMLEGSFERTLVVQMKSRLRADLLVTSGLLSGAWVSAPLSESVLNELRMIPGIALAVGEQRKSVPYRQRFTVLDAYDASCFRDRRVCEWPLATGALPDALAQVAGGDGAIVSSSFANQFGTRAGDNVSLNSPHGPQVFRIVGITNSEPENAVIMSRDRYRRSWNDSLVTYLHLTLTQGAERGSVEAALAQGLGPKYRLQVRSGAEFIEYLASQVRAGFKMFYPTEAIMFFLVLVGIGDMLATRTIERTRQFGMMRAVGLSRSQLFKMMVLEGTAIGLLGFLLAIAGGLALGIFWVEVQFPAILGWTLDLHVPYRFALGAALLTVLICLLGSLLPSLRASRLSIPDALRNE